MAFKGFGAASSSSVAVLGALRSVGNAMAESISSLIAGILPARAMFDAASSVTDSAKSVRRESCDASQPNCRICPPDLPPRTMTTKSENGVPPPLPPRGPSRASPYAELGK